MYFNSSNKVGIGTSVITGGFYNYSGASTVCYNIFVQDTISLNYCTEEICFSSLPICCTEISARQARPEEEIIEDDAAHLGSIMNVYPNPTNDKVNISYEIDEGKSATITVTDMFTGRIAQYEFLKEQGKIELNTSGLKAGVYFVVLRIDGNITSSSKMIVVH